MITALVGGQFGSEGKGAVAAHLHRTQRFSVAVRVGAANAGHTIYDCIDGEKRVMQQLPCAAYLDPECALLIGPGALITPHILQEEILGVTAWRVSHGFGAPEIVIDPRAHVITDGQIEREQHSGLAERIGSTSTIAKEGIGTAQADRVMRDEHCLQFGNLHSDLTDMVAIGDVPNMLHWNDRAGHNVLLEGTQGAGLSNTTGFFPFCTSRNTTAAGLAADCGVAPNKVKRVVLAVRTFPIRVAGNSGPFWQDSEEITWESIGIDPENERTTVTKKVRRVATFSMDQVVQAVMLNGATDIALMFADYLEPGIAGEHGFKSYVAPRAEELARRVEDATKVRVSLVGTGPNTMVMREAGR